MLQEMDRLRQDFDQLFGVGPVRLPQLRSAFLPGTSARTYPLVNLRDEGDSYCVEALAPGVNPTTLSVTATRDGLMLSGEKPAPEGIRPEQDHRSERSAGRFSRSFSLPTAIDVNKISAEYKNGLLMVTIPKAEESKPKSISIVVAN
jgi:HSP20 family protein